MHQGGAREIGKAHFAQPARAPDPGPLDRIDHAGQEDDEDQERPHLDPFCQRAGNDRRRGRDEHHLEEPVGHRRVGRIGQHGGVRGRFSGIVGVEQRQLGRGRVIEKFERADPALVDAGVHQRITDDVEHQPRDRIERDVLQADRGRVLGAHQTGFKHRETGRHQHDENAVHQERERVEHERGFGRNRRFGVAGGDDSHRGEHAGDETEFDECFHW